MPSAMLALFVRSPPRASKKESVFDVICESLHHLFDLSPAIFSSLCKADGGKMSINIDFSERGAEYLFTTDWSACMWLLAHHSL